MTKLDAADIEVLKMQRTAKMPLSQIAKYFSVSIAEIMEILEMVEGKKRIACRQNPSKSPSPSPAN